MRGFAKSAPRVGLDRLLGDEGPGHGKAPSAQPGPIPLPVPRSGPRARQRNT